MRIRRVLLGLAAAGLGAALLASAQGRPVVGWTPEQLASRARIICVGIPLKVAATDRRGQIELLGNAPDPVRIMAATIHVLAVTKGSVGSKIEVRYPVLDYDALQARGGNGVANGPLQISLAPGTRYRLYLNPVPGKPWYEGALAGEYDDGAAVQPLAAGK